MNEKMREALEALDDLAMAALRCESPDAVRRSEATVRAALSQQPESEPVDDWLVYCLEYIGAGDPDDIECDDYELYAENDEGQSGTITVSISEKCRKAATALQGPQLSAQDDPDAALWETFVKIADYLDINPDEARKALGKPSDVFIAAIESRVQQSPQVPEGYRLAPVKADMKAALKAARGHISPMKCAQIYEEMISFSAAPSIAEKDDG